MSGKENREQIPTEFNVEETQRALRMQDRVEGEQRNKTVSDFPQAAALGQVLKDLDFPADRLAIIRFVEQSNRRRGGGAAAGPEDSGAPVPERL